MENNLINKLPKISGQYRQNYVLKNWFDVGGKVEILFKPKNLEDLCYFLKNVDQDIKINIFGAGSNVIVDDKGLSGVVIKFGRGFSDISRDDNVITAGSAVLCGNLAQFCKNEAYSGLEFFSGIPGSVGGAVAMNAGCYGDDVSKKLISALAVDYQGNIHHLKREDFNFSYRKNNLSQELIFVEASFKLEKSEIDIVAKKIEKFSLSREESQPIRAKTGGSTFKNPYPEDLSKKKAWQLIDEAGCRGLEFGGAKFSEKHCNFMINFNNASAQDLIKLGNIVKNKVKEKSGIELEWEIKILSDE